jgi:glucan phosphorylase
MAGFHQRAVEQVWQLMPHYESHSTNGVAAIHSKLLRETTVRDLAEIFPERFDNKTNGVTPRRWLFLANPGLARVIAGAIGDSWITDFNKIAELQPTAEDAAFRSSFLKAKARRQVAVRQLAASDLRADRGSRQNLRLSDQAHP